ncbi:MAG: bifunctional diaminohydroxyphosphoribosylaminopyrimidine deaminase/5-amino-6-(5-phosphoribosylamino)uracil reductase RibD [Campylobacterota bacterium]|nr:bifunctional diaminohydroxyphosphoribosylaminopyrimidine deaminase/5-amino-6-(5-phosphoribosylamino)uracil reductase RibD [Campylobacterota bacterium]
MSDKNGQYIQLCINEAWRYQLLTYPNPAVGACVVKNNEILAVEAHKEAGSPHAEVNALKSAFLKSNLNSKLKDITTSHEIHDFLKDNHNNFFKDCEIYVTLEPCNHIGKTPACAMLLESIGIKKVYIGTLDPNKTASGGKERLENAGIEVEVLYSVESDNLLYPFVKWQDKSFQFFKIAMREDGSIDGGYITTQKSLNLVHEIRTKLDLMVIGGQTVRDDRPTLDSRFAKVNKAPDILIYSNKKEFDKKIALFEVNGRVVNISDKIKFLNREQFIMYEGGYNLLERVKNDIDMLVVFISHKIESELKFDIKTFGFEPLYKYNINEFDEVVFLKNRFRKNLL